jgi:mannosyltransferase OCH1-like enzyme
MDLEIPKIIMQTWKTKDVPEKWKESPISIKNVMPEWKKVIMTDEDNRNFVIKHFPDFLPYYDGFEYPIQRADAIRYMWLYINGGIYVDLDIAIQKNLEEVIGNEKFYLVTSGNLSSSFTNALMISKPKVDFWLRVIDEMKKPVPFYYFTKHFKVMYSTGPGMLTRVAQKYNKRFGVIPAKQFNNCNVCNIDKDNLENCMTPEDYTKILRGSSWCSWDSKLLNMFLCNWRQIKKMIIYFILITIIIILILVFYRK